MFIVCQSDSVLLTNRCRSHPLFVTLHRCILLVAPYPGGTNIMCLLHHWSQSVVKSHRWFGIEHGGLRDLPTLVPELSVER